MPTEPKMTTEEIDLGLAVICASDELPTPIEGWSAERLALMIGCSPETIRRRTAAALIKCRLRLPQDILEDLKQ